MTEERSSLKYIRLAAFLADKPPAENEVVLSLRDIEELIDESLPPSARWPSWWRNDDRKMHSRAWLTAGWKVAEMKGGDSQVVFVRDGASGE